MTTASHSPLKLEKIQSLCLLVAILIYAFFSSPTPDHPGIIEVIIGLLLIIAVSSAGVAQALVFNPRAPLWRSAGQGLLYFGFTAGVLAAILNGNHHTQIFRDLIPFLFMLLPLFYHVKGDLEQRRLLLTSGFAGLIFAIRALAEFWADPLGLSFVHGEPTYLANAPTLLFAAIMLLAGTGAYFLKAFTPKALLFFVISLVLSAMILTAMAVTLQRASLGYFVFSMVVLALLGLIKNPSRMMVIIVIVFLSLIPFIGEIDLITDLLQEKTEVFGSNMRGAEWQAVWAEVSQSPLKAFFGLGWGGTFESPAVADVRVNFTHGLLSSALLKTGLAGVCFFVLYIGALLHTLLHNLKTAPVIVLAILGPVLIDVFLYASFKSFDFGLILLLIPSLRGLKAADLLQD